jgi:hypothetical protein
MKRHPMPLWDRQGKLIFVLPARDDRHSRPTRRSPLRNGLPERSTPHSRKLIGWGNSPKRI